MADVQVLSFDSAISFAESLRKDIENLCASLEELTQTNEDPALVLEIQTACEQSGSLLQEFEDTSHRALEALLHGRDPDPKDSNLLTQLGFIIPSSLPDPLRPQSNMSTFPLQPTAHIDEDSTDEPPQLPPAAPEVPQLSPKIAACQFPSNDQSTDQSDPAPMPPLEPPGSPMLRKAPPPPLLGHSTPADNDIDQPPQQTTAKDEENERNSDAISPSEAPQEVPAPPFTPASTDQPRQEQMQTDFAPTEEIVAPLPPSPPSVAQTVTNGHEIDACDELRREIARLAAENEQLRADSLGFAEERDRRRQELDDTRRSLEEQKLETETLRGEKCGLQDECSRLCSELESARALAERQMSDTREAVRAKEVEVEALCEERQRLVDALEGKENETNQLRAALEELGHEAQSLQKQLTQTHEEEIKLMEAKLLQSQDDASRPKEREADMLAEIARLEHEVARLGSEAGRSLRGEDEYVTQLQCTIEELRKERDELRELVREQHRAFYDSVESLVKNENSSLRQAMEQLQREVQRLELSRPLPTAARHDPVETTAIQAIQEAEATLSRGDLCSAAPTPHQPPTAEPRQQLKAQRQAEAWYQPTDPFDPIDVAVQEVLKSLRCPVKIDLNRLSKGEYMADKRIRVRLIGDTVQIQKGALFTPLSAYLQALYAQHFRRQQPNDLGSEMLRSGAPSRLSTSHGSSPRSASAPRVGSERTTTRDNLVAAKALLGRQRISANSPEPSPRQHETLLSSSVAMLQGQYRPESAKKSPIQIMGEAYEDALRQADMREGDDEDKIKLLKKLALRQHIASMKKSTSTSGPASPRAAALGIRR